MHNSSQTEFNEMGDYDFVFPFYLQTSRKCVQMTRLASAQISLKSNPHISRTKVQSLMNAKLFHYSNGWHNIYF